MLVWTALTALALATEPSALERTLAEALDRAMATLSSLAPKVELWVRADEIISAFEVDAAENEAVAMPHLTEFMASTSGLPRAVVTLMGQSAAEATSISSPK